MIRKKFDNKMLKNVKFLINGCNLMFIIILSV